MCGEYALTHSKKDFVIIPVSLKFGQIDVFKDNCIGMVKQISDPGLWMQQAWLLQGGALAQSLLLIFPAFGCVAILLLIFHSLVYIIFWKIKWYYEAGLDQTWDWVCGCD